MAEPVPFKKMPGDLLAFTNAACSDAGKWTSDHGDLLRRGDYAARLRVVMDGWLTEEAAQKRAAEEANRIQIMDSGYTGEWARERCRGPYWGYQNWNPRSALERRDALAPHFPKLDWSHVEALAERYYANTASEGASGYRDPPKGERKLVLPTDADGGLIIFPKLDAVLKCVKKPKKSWKPLNIAVEYILGVLKEVYPNFKDWTDGNVGPEYERLLEATAKYLAKIDAETPGDVLVLPFQAGAMFAGYTVRSSIGHMEALKRHVPAHDFSNLCLMVTDPERFVEGTLFADCPGSERAPLAGGQFYSASYVCFSGGGRRFRSSRVGGPGCRFGSSSFVVSPE